MTTGIKQLTCTRNEELQLLSFDKDIEFPILVSVNLLLTSPADIDAASKPVVENETILWNSKHSSRPTPSVSRKFVAIPY